MGDVEVWKRENIEMSLNLRPQGGSKELSNSWWMLGWTCSPQGQRGTLTGETGISSSLPGWIALENTETESQKYRNYREFCVVFQGDSEISWGGAVVSGAQGSCD